MDDTDVLISEGQTLVQMDTEVGIYYEALSVMPEDMDAARSIDIEALIGRSEYLMAVIARSGAVMADAKFLVTMRSAERMRAYRGLTATEQKALIAGDVAEEQRLFDRAERLNRMATHSLEMLRSVLSWRKTEMQMQDYASHNIT